MIKKIKKWLIVDKPDYAKWTFIMVVFIQLANPFTIMWINMFAIGLMSPDTVVDYETVSEDIVDNIMVPVQSLHESGQEIAKDNPTMGVIIAYAMMGIIWSIWVAYALMILNIIRHLIFALIKNIKGKRQEKQEKELSWQRGR